MSDLKLRDYDTWKNLNVDEDFSIFDYLYHVLRDGSLSSDVWFAMREVFWPEFIQYREFVLIKRLFSEEKVDALLQDGQQVEFWSNLLTLDPYFEDEEDPEAKLDALGQTLALMWNTKLSQDFPSHKFVVKVVSDTETGDFGVTFLQAVG